MDIVEVFWGVIAVLGLLSSAILIWIVNRQRQAMIGINNGRRRQLRKNIRWAWGVFAIHLINASLAVPALLNDVPLRNPSVAWLLALASAILMVNTLLDARMALQDSRGRL